MPLILPGNVATATAPTAFSVDNSCRFDRGSSAYMYRTPTGAGNRRTFTFSAWIKRGAAANYTSEVTICSQSQSGHDGNYGIALWFNSGGSFMSAYNWQTSTDMLLYSNAEFRDPTA